MTMIKNPTSRVWYIFGGGWVFAGLIFGVLWVYAHRHDADLQDVLVNFVVAWIPTLLAILIAFVPDLRKAHFAWRLAIVAVGMLWSVLLARQQILSVRTSRIDQQAAIMNAVNQSDAHTDQEISTLRTDMKASVNGLSSQLEKTGSEITGNILSNKPAKVEPAKLTFSLFEPGNTFPVTSTSLRAGVDNEFSLDLTVKNVSSTPANQGEIWISLPPDCIYATEPAGFDKPSGTDESTRHRRFDNLNPGVSLEKMTITVKLTKTHSGFEMAMRYSCAACRELAAPQPIRIAVLPPYKFQVPPVKLN
jgi:hypothetical protein